MPKVEPKRQGVREYVRLANLPDKQAGNLMEWLPQSFMTKIGGEQNMLEDCIEYEDYEFWFEHCYLNAPDHLEEQI